MLSTGRQVTLLLALVCALYYNALGNAFHYDDFHSIVHNPHIRQPSNFPTFFSDPSLFSVDPRQAMYRPLLLLTYGVNYMLGGLDPVGYHFINGLLHAANAILLLFLARELGVGNRLAFVAALMFAAHPLNSEVVHYVSSRSEALMAFFFIAACWAYARHGVSRSWGWYGVAVLCSAMAMLSKSVAAVLMVMLPLCDWLAGRDPLRLWGRYLPFVGLGLLYVFFTRQFLGKALAVPVRAMDVQFYTQIKAAIYYLYIGVVPVNLNVEHQFFPSHSLFEPVVFLSAFCLCSLAWVLWQSQWRPPIFATAWVVIVLVPTFVVPLIVLVNEHRLYLAMAGWCLLLTWVLEGLIGRRYRLALSGLAMYTMLLAVLTLQRGQVWSDELTLWNDAAAKAPSMLKPHLRLADALERNGRLPEAEEAYLHALALRPQHVATRNNLGVLYKKQNRLPEAEHQFRALLAVSPDIIQARLNLADLLLRQGQWRQAEVELLRALDFADTGGLAQKRLARIALQFAGDAERARAYGEQALALVEDAAIWTTQGVALRALGHVAQAEAAYRRALSLEPESIDTWFNLGNLYRDLQQPDKALKAFDNVAKIGGESPLAARAKQEIKAINITTQ